MGICTSKGKYSPHYDRYQNQEKTPAPHTHRSPDHHPAAVAAAAKSSGPPKSPRHNILRSDSILGKPLEDVKLHYTIGKELGRGQFGVTYLCTENSSGKQYACKSISKRKLVTKNDKEDIRREIHIMQHLSGQPNIVEFKGAYEDKQSVHLIMELCAGGELFDKIIAKGHYSEKAAASICRSIVNVVHICHFMGVMHRDLKPENFLLASKEEDAMLKATDFGLSVFIEDGEVLALLFGFVPHVFFCFFYSSVLLCMFWLNLLILFMILEGQMCGNLFVA